MSSLDGAWPRRSRAHLRLTLAVAAVIVASALPLADVIAPGGWLAAAAVLTAALLTAGHLAHAARLPALAASGIQLALWALFLTALFLSDTALLWIIPTPETVRAVPPLFTEGMTEILVGSAPLDAGAPLSFLLVAAVGLFTIALDHVVVTARMPLLAVVGVVTVWLVPAIAVPSDMDVFSFAVLAVAVLFLLRTETRARETAGPPPAAPRPGPPARRAGVGAAAVGIGAIAVVVAITVTPLLPTPTARPAAGGLGATMTIDPSLNLGHDLRQPVSVPVLNVRSNTPVPPYLRVATLSSFDGAQWRPDRVRTLPLEAVGEGDDGGEGEGQGGGGFGEVEVDESLRVTAYRTTVEVTNLSSSWLPVAYPAVGVTGLDDAWEAMPYNRTVVSDSATTQGQVYEVLTHLPRPTREQIRATTAGGTVLRDATYDLPDVPMDIITQTTLEVTAGAETDYDKLVALQSWFRGSDFTYSLRAPVQQGFDGSGIDAIEQFLLSRQGYCVHFASAFAVMARTLDMPSRIVVGYLPGTGNGEVVDGETEYQVTSDQLHAWPEVHFAGVGWVPFEPTKSLGTPTSFLPERVPTADDAGEDLNAGPAPSTGAGPALEAPEPSIAPQLDDQAVPDAAAPPLLTLSSALIALGVLVALAIPALVREVVRRRRLAAAAAGDAAAAWLSVREAAVDFGIAVPAAESPRAFGERLVADHGAPAGAVSQLVEAIERASYAPAPASAPAGARREGLADAAASVHSALAASTPRDRRVRALLAPRSLIVRPGSAYAAERAPV
ncbi:DUF3488 and transglutaminase-like domain-containing protein [Microbacterium sp. zg.Y625]|uniref:transglutaminase family protein n=1 Tax=Microbacterium jiangjiandongii TaxID=3049071 RepID=UPI00214AAC27|nr:MULTISPECIES: DUF3488 and transglutaminase-like domain-containing protein [unclassified Microbacterium]MCR2791860.1 DUF3488 and transglutaminase-like domain-containing protein [Microbacterium sp. zg.Y625]WIM24674.1 DUF3488 and transglutaminase-like domain-containing protein [Microbacterium sp. zg-Y625]